MDGVRSDEGEPAIQADKATYDTALAVWEAETEHVDDLHYMATHLDEVYDQSAEAGFSLRLQKDEHVIFAIIGGGLVEPRASGGSYQGGSTGVSFRVMKGNQLPGRQPSGHICTGTRSPEDHRHRRIDLHHDQPGGLCVSDPQPGLATFEDR